MLFLMATLSNRRSRSELACAGIQVETELEPELEPYREICGNRREKAKRDASRTSGAEAELESYRAAYGVLVDIPRVRPSSRSMKSNMMRTELIGIPSPNKRV
jgi:hypothetical protein